MALEPRFLCVLSRPGSGIAVHFFRVRVVHDQSLWCYQDFPCPSEHTWRAQIEHYAMALKGHVHLSIVQTYITFLFPTHENLIWMLHGDSSTWCFYFKLKCHKNLLTKHDHARKFLSVSWLQYTLPQKCATSLFSCVGTNRINTVQLWEWLSRIAVNLHPHYILWQKESHILKI